MRWLTRDDQVLASLVDAPLARWRRAPEGALLLRPPALVHTLTGAASLDLAWCRRAEPNGSETAVPAVLEVRRLNTLGRWRVAVPRLGCTVVVVAPAGAFERWKLQVGDRLEVAG